MNRSTLLEVCKERKMYLNPELNEVCYFHFQGFHKIENLEEFDNCVSLWLQNNCIQVIENVDCLYKLQSLMLNENQICKVDSLVLLNLLYLNLANNVISSIGEGCQFPKLEVLILKNNFLDYEGVLPIFNYKNLQTLDLEGNDINDQLILKDIKQLPHLKVLSVKDNPFLQNISYYKKQLVYNTDICYIDGVAQTDKDRLLAYFLVNFGEQSMIEQQQIILQEEKDIILQNKIRMNAYLKGYPLEKQLEMSRQFLKYCDKQIPLYQHSEITSVIEANDFAISECFETFDCKHTEIEILHFDEGDNGEDLVVFVEEYQPELYEELPELDTQSNTRV